MTRSGLPSPFTSATATAERLDTGGEGLLVLEGAIAVAQQHAHGVIIGVGDDDVGLAIAVHVRHRHGRREPQLVAKVCGF